MNTKLFCFVPALFVGIHIHAQTHQLLLKPGAAEGKDAYIHDYSPNQNLGTSSDYSAVAWTCNGPACIARSLIDFDWTLIPEGATITNAELTLFINPTSSNGTSSGDNVSWIERVTSSWDEMTVTWNNQPTVTSTNRISAGPITTTSGSYQFDVTQLMNDMTDDPQSFGFRISLQTEAYYRRLLFASSDNADCSLHPELLVEYTLADPADQPIGFLSLQPDATAGKDAYIHDFNTTQNLGNSTDFASVAWTCSGPPCIARSLIDFDLTSIPSNTEILEATLFLAQNPTSTNGPHAGANASTLKRITSPWDEQTVTWATAPTSTSFNQVSLNASTSSTQDYVVDVTGLIQDYVDDPAASFGMMISLVDETPYSRLTFASSDHTNCALRPRLEISYRPSTLGIPTDPKEPEFVHIYPNPTSDDLNIETRDDVRYYLVDAEGRVILTGHTVKNTESTLDVSGLRAGIYSLQMESEGKQITRKIIKN